MSIHERERIDELARLNPDAVTLACSLSLAARIEPELVRAARLLIPGATVVAETDLWFSDLVSAQNPRGITLDARVAAELRKDLATDPDLLKRSWALIESHHRDARWSICTEEAIHRLSLSDHPDDRQRTESLLREVGRRMERAGSDKGPARWIARALVRFPAEVRALPICQELALAARARLDGATAAPAQDGQQ